LVAARRLNPAARFVLAAVAALAAHVVVALLLLVLDVLDVLPFLRTPDAVSMRSAVAQQQDKQVDEQPMQIETLVDELQKPDEKSEEEKKREEEKKKEEEDKNPHGQVVDVAKPLIEQRPDKSNYVSEYDTKVDHETKLMGREQGGAKNGATPTPPPVPQGERPDAQPQHQAQSGKGGKPGPLAMRELLQRQQQHGASEAPPPPDRDGELPQRGHNGAPAVPLKHAPVGQQGDGRNRTPGSEAPSGTPGLPRPNLQPTPEMLQRAIGKGGGSMDYLKDIDDGDATALNSKKWKHAPFFNRIKRQVADEWHPEMVYVRHDPNGNVYGVKDRVTVLRIHLQPDGKLGGWTVLQSSGVDFLDDEAIDAFKKAAPFPNPPKDLVEADGQIHFNFAFIFELSGHGSLKVYKYN
jgi:TonB family protein